VFEEHDAAAGADDAAQLGEGFRRRGDRAEDERGEGRFERVVAEGQALGPRLHEPDARRPPRLLARDEEHLAARLARHAARAARVVREVQTRPRADFEEPRVVRQLREGCGPQAAEPAAFEGPERALVVRGQPVVDGPPRRQGFWFARPLQNVRAP
jgi:hypothetical protein